MSNPYLPPTEVTYAKGKQQSCLVRIFTLSLFAAVGSIVGLSCGSYFFWGNPAFVSRTGVNPLVFWALAILVVAGGSGFAYLANRLFLSRR